MSHSPQPSVMPGNRVAWRREIHLSNFVNTAYQYQDLQSLGDVQKVLIIGPGQGVDTQFLKWAGYVVTTFDIDDTFEPDHIGSVHAMDVFGDRQFDVVIASHVLEHLPVSFLDAAIAELARVARCALVYVPVAGRPVQLRFNPSVRFLGFSLIVDVFNWMRGPDGVTPRYAGGQHYWELGMRGFRKADVRRRLETSFEVLREYRNIDWLPSYNFVLRSR
jgi:hypothetical protein